jgi:copper chaperone CopZ
MQHTILTHCPTLNSASLSIRFDKSSMSRSDELSQPLLAPEASLPDGGDSRCDEVLYKQGETGTLKVCVCGKPTCTCNLPIQASMTPGMAQWHPTFSVPLNPSSTSGELAQQLLFSSPHVQGIKINNKRVEVLAPQSSTITLKRSIASLLQSLGLLDESFYKSLPPATMITSQYRVQGMTCSSCVASLESLIIKVPGVQSVSVSLLNNSMQAVHDPEIASLDIITAAIEDAGYEGR